MLASRKPYLLRAIYEWIADNDLTPYLLVDASLDGVAVPRGSVQNDRIVLNMSVHSVDQLQLGNEAITFDARFGGRVENIYVPLRAVLAIYARENGEGMSFNPEDEVADQQTTNDSHGARAKGSAESMKAKSPGLRIVK